MHNIHFICVTAPDGETALRTAEAEIESWGDENNWRSFIKAISKSGQVVKGSGEEIGAYNTIEGINQEFNAMLEIDTGDKLMAELEEMYSRLKQNGKLMARDWWVFERRVRDMGEFEWVRDNLKNETFNVFKHEYRPYQYTEFGVTHAYFDGSPDGTNQKWCVVLDMHS